MKKNQTISLILLAAMLPLSACVTDPETGNRTISKAAIGGVGGALGGYLLGDLIGGRRDRTEKIVGAGIGALAGAGVGYYMDEQEKKLRQQTAGTGVNVIRDGDNLVLDMPSEITFGVDSSNIDAGIWFNVRRRNGRGIVYRLARRSRLRDGGRTCFAHIAAFAFGRGGVHGSRLAL